MIQHYKKIETASKIKKFYTTISQAILSSELNNGPSVDLEKKPVPTVDGKVDLAGKRGTELEYFNKYLNPYLKIINIDENPKEEQDETGESNRIKVYLADGTFFYFNNGYCAHLIYDTNGDKQPNTDGRDRFNFLICNRNYAPRFFGDGTNFKNNFGPYCRSHLVCNTRPKALNMCKTDPGYCTQLLMIDGWEFKEEYPYKL